MDCPACGRQLYKMDVADIVVDVCERGCGGIWFDNFELKKVDEKHESAGEKLLDVTRNPDVKVDYTQKRKCPKCQDQPMLQHFMSIKREIEVDECPACGGLWLDYGELGGIRDQYDNDAERKEAAKAYFAEVFGPEFEKLKAENDEKHQKTRRIAHVFRFVCPSYYIPGEQSWGAF